MRERTSRLLVLPLWLVGAWCQALPVMQLTDNATSDRSARISGTNIVWVNGSDTAQEIMLYDGVSTVRLTNNGMWDNGPVVDGNAVFWMGHDGNDYEIYRYADGSTTRITDNTVLDQAPSAVGGLVAWQRYSPNLDLFYYDGTVERNATNIPSGSTCIQPALSSTHAAWSERVSTADNFDLYTLNLATGVETRVTNTAWVTESVVCMQGSNIVYQAVDGTTTRLYLYNGSSSRLIANSYYTASIFGDRIAYSVNLGSNNYEIYVYDIATWASTRITNNSTTDIGPLLTDSMVVWRGFDGSDYELYAYEFSTDQILRLTDNAYNDDNPQVSGNRVVWEASVGGDYELFLTQVPEPATGVLLAAAALLVAGAHRRRSRGVRHAC